MLFRTTTSGDVSVSKLKNSPGFIAVSKRVAEVVDLIEGTTRAVSWMQYGQT